MVNMFSQYKPNVCENSVELKYEYDQSVNHGVLNILLFIIIFFFFFFLCDRYTFGSINAFEIEIYLVGL